MPVLGGTWSTEERLAGVGASRAHDDTARTCRPETDPYLGAISVRDLGSCYLRNHGRPNVAPGALRPRIPRAETSWLVRRRAMIPRIGPWAIENGTENSSVQRLVYVTLVFRGVSAEDPRRTGVQVTAVDAV
ncbi:hypothetical protein PI125_g23018 [Phytophthora idaei]|nr:hypothetical protein PI125_g23018 [Phytophthora idaei]